MTKHWTTLLKPKLGNFQEKNGETYQEVFLDWDSRGKPVEESSPTQWRCSTSLLLVLPGSWVSKDSGHLIHFLLITGANLGLECNFLQLITSILGFHLWRNWFCTETSLLKLYCKHLEMQYAVHFNIIRVMQIVTRIMMRICNPEW